MDHRAAEVDTKQAAPLRRAVLLVVGIVLLAVSAALGVWIYFHGQPPFITDVWWNTLLAAWASPFALALSQVMNFIGGGLIGVFVMPAVIAVILVIMRRPWGAAYLVASSILSSAAVQLVKQTVGRARPDDILVTTDVGSYPSGHVAAAATTVVVLAILFPRLWVWIVGAAYVMLMAFTRTYLHAHWLTDTIGGAALGAGVSLILAAAFAVALAREPRPKARRG